MIFFFEFLREHAMKITNFEKKKLLLTEEQKESYKNSNIYYICKVNFENKYLKDKKYRKVRDHFHYMGECRGAAHSIRSLKYSVPKIFFIVFHNVSN